MKLDTFVCLQNEMIIISDVIAVQGASQLNINESFSIGSQAAFEYFDHVFSSANNTKRPIPGNF